MIVMEMMIKMIIIKIIIMKIKKNYEGGKLTMRIKIKTKMQ